MEEVWKRGEPNGGLDYNCMVLYPGASYQALDRHCDWGDGYPLCQLKLAR